VIALPAARCPLPAAEARSRRHARVSSRSAVRTTSRRRAQTTLAPHLQSPTRTHPAAPAAVAQHTALKRTAQQPSLATACPTPPQRTLDCAPQRPPAPSVMRALRSRAARAPQHTQRPRSTQRSSAQHSSRTRADHPTLQQHTAAHLRLEASCSEGEACVPLWSRCPRQLEGEPRAHTCYL
jgi:hypothetical protein